MGWGDVFEGGFGTCAQYCPCAASEQKWVKNRELKRM